MNAVRPFRRLEEASVIAFPIAWLGLATHTWRSFTTPSFAALALVVGYLFADFGSGVVHWFFDTWLSPETPLLGGAFVRTFREHHTDPSAICRHDFVETNGSNMLVASLMILVGAVSSSEFVACALLVAALFTSVTSQIHKWAHLEPERVPRVVAWLQRARLVLSKRGHAAHHVAPYARCYCITSGWVNAPLDTLRFFRAIEWVVRSRNDVHGDARVVVSTTKQ
jgi:hypothetical protein